MSLMRLTTSSKPLKVTFEALTQNYWNFYTVRWGKKPRWMPIAPSKLFKIRVRPKLPVEEEEEIKRLMNNYRTMIKSLNKYFEDRYSVANQEQFDVEQHKKSVDEDFARCSAINDEWNLEQSVLREQRVAKEHKVTLEQARQRLQDSIEANAEKLKAAEEVVRREKIASADFTMPDKLDAVIEYAINNPVDYNYSLDLDGNKIWGRETQPPLKVEDDKKLRLKQ